MSLFSPGLKKSQVLYAQAVPGGTMPMLLEVAWTEFRPFYSSPVIAATEQSVCMTDPISTRRPA